MILFVCVCVLLAGAEVGASPATAAEAPSEDAGPPETKIYYAPRPLTNSSEPTFKYSSPEYGNGFECSVDGGPFFRCGFEKETIAPALADGPHSFAVRAVDQTGNVDPTPASRRFEVDSTPPRLKILTGPRGLIRDRTPRITFEVSGADRVECALQGARAASVDSRFGPCTGPRAHRALRPLPDDEYGFRVRASDRAGNQVDAYRGFELYTAPGKPPNPYAGSALYFGHGNGIRIAIRVRGRDVILVNVLVRLSCVGPKGRRHYNRIRLGYAGPEFPLAIDPRGRFRWGPSRSEEPYYSFEEHLEGRVRPGVVTGSFRYVTNMEYRRLRCRTGSMFGEKRGSTRVKFRATPR